MTTLSRRASAAPVPAPAAGSLKGFMPAWAATSRVLIMDDNEGILKVLTRLLQHAGVGEIKSCADPVEGLRLYQEFVPDLVLLDRHMPGLDGFEVLEQLQPLTTVDAPVPVVMLTGDQDQSCRTQALTLGASDFLLKPFDSTEVLLRVRALLETRRLQRRLAEHNQELEARVAERTLELEASQLEMLQRLAVAADLRDDETGQHTHRVGRLAERLGLALGFSVSRAKLLARAAPLHDIGKIGVPDAILRKPGKLTEEEFAQMKCHAAGGARILEGGRSELIQLAELIARHITSAGTAAVLDRAGRRSHSAGGSNCRGGGLLRRAYPQAALPGRGIDRAHPRYDSGVDRIAFRPRPWPKPSFGWSTPRLSLLRQLPRGQHE